jgi:putative flippase GtrA
MRYKLPAMSLTRETIKKMDVRQTASRFQAGQIGRTLRQFSSFFVVGVATTAVHYGVLVMLVETWSVYPVWATTAGFLVAALFSYLLNRHYTFEERPAFHTGLLKYYAAMSVGLALNSGTMALLTWWGLFYIYAQLIASGVALIWNFFAARSIVFRSEGNKIATNVSPRSVE